MQEIWAVWTWLISATTPAIKVLYIYIEQRLQEWGYALFRGCAADMHLVVHVHLQIDAVHLYLQAVGAVHIHLHAV